MKNISKREKIILVVVVIAVLYFVFDIFVLGDTVTRSPKMDEDVMRNTLMETDALVASVLATIKDSELAEVEEYIIDRAGRPWPRDPFFVGMPTDRTDAVADDALLVTFTYTGYIVMGDALVAIINGVDYRVGEELEKPGFVLQSVTPNHVVIEHTELRQRITVPFMEDY